MKYLDELKTILLCADKRDVLDTFIILTFIIVVPFALLAL